MLLLLWCRFDERKGCKRWKAGTFEYKKLKLQTEKPNFIISSSSCGSLACFLAMASHNWGFQVNSVLWGRVVTPCPTTNLEARILYWGSLP
jgi:hypothetical protein